MANESNNTVVTTIRIPKELRDALDSIGKRDDRSLNYIIKNALQEYVENHQAKDQHPQ